MKITINNKKVNGHKFAYDGCHKIYIIENDEDLKEAENLKYDIYDINKLKEIYNESDRLRFIYNWECNEHYCYQGEFAEIVEEEE